MPTRTIILLAATIGIFILIVLGIIITVLVTGNVFIKKHDKEIKNKIDKKDKKEEANR